MKLFYSISEVANLLEVPKHTLRHWEAEFPHIAPRRSPAGERQYHQKDIEELRKIKFLMHERKMTTEGAKELIKVQAKGKASPIGRRTDLLQRLHHLRTELIAIRQEIQTT